MNIDVVVNGRTWKVALEPAEPAGTFTVTIKGKSRVVDVSWIDDETLSLIDGGAVREIRLQPRGDNGVVGVELGGNLYQALVSAGNARLKPHPGDAEPMGAQKRNRDPFSASDPAKMDPDSFSAVAITAPMPGRVVRVLVAVGDRVAARQGVVVVEAMKMENELRTPKDGVVKEILAVPGAAVDTGAVLVLVADQ
jgi:pyruvate carboxylase subunit B